MAFSLRKSSDRGVVGLDIDGRYLAAAQVDSGRVVRGASLELPAGLVRDGEVADRDGLAEALKDFVRRGRPAEAACGSAWPTSRSWSACWSCPRIEDAKQRDAAVRFQAAEAIAMPLDEAVLDHQVAGYAEAPDGTAAHAGRARGRAPLDDRGAARGRQEGRPQARGRRPRRVRARPHPRRGVADGADDAARVFCHLGGVTNLAIAVGTTCFFTRPLVRGLGRATTPARGSPTRSGSRSTTT